MILPPTKAILAILALTSCATATPDPAPLAATDPAPTPTERLAQALTRADLAYAKGDREGLAQNLRRIDNEGAHLLDASQPDPRADWRKRVPDAAPPLRGRALGPAFSRGTVRAGDTITTEQVFLSGQSVAIALGTIPQGDIRLRVIDADKQMVCEQAPDQASQCRFLPIFTQRYRIELQNAGRRDARYYLVVD